MAVDDLAAERVKILYQDLVSLNPTPTQHDLRQIAAEMQHAYTAHACVLPEARTTFENIGQFVKERAK